MKSLQRGYMALMATIIISLILLVMVAGQAFLGSVVRTSVQGSESKEQSYTLAQSCIRLAQLEHRVHSSYAGDKTYTFSGGGCAILPLQFNTPSAGFTVLQAKAVVAEAQTTIEAVVDANFDNVSIREVSHF